MGRIVFALFLLIAFGETGAVGATPQLNIDGFSECLSSAHPAGPLPALGELAAKYEFNSSDGLLIYLAIYPGKYVPFYSEALQKPGLKRWSGDWESREESLAETLLSLAGRGTIYPQDLFRSAVPLCDGDLFCTALTTQNVLRTMGRHPQAIYHDRLTGEDEDRNPAWFKDKKEKWLLDLPKIQSALICSSPAVRGIAGASGTISSGCSRLEFTKRRWGKSEIVRFRGVVESASEPRISRRAGRARESPAGSGQCPCRARLPPMGPQRGKCRLPDSGSLCAASATRQSVIFCGNRKPF